MDNLRKTSVGKAAAVEALIAAPLLDMGFEIVRVLLSGKQRMVLQIMAERVGGGAVTVDDCATISRAVAAILDVEDPIREAYNLEVSSTGIDRPLTRLGDFERFAGHQARVEMDAAVEGRRRFIGRLCGLEGSDIAIETEEGKALLPFTGLSRAKLLLTDELLAASQGDQAPNGAFDMTG